MKPLPLCRHMKEPTGPGRVRCDSTKIVKGPDGVPVERCKPGLFCFDHEPCDPPPPPLPQPRQTVALVRPPCRHLGAETGESVVCNVGCPNSSKTTLRPLFACAVHGKTTREHFVRGQQSCNPAICKDYAAPAPETPDELEASIRSMSPPPRPPGWVDRRDVQETHRRLFHEQLASPPTYPGGFSGDGVIIPGGGPYWPSAYVAVRSLRHFGCTLPIQVWHRGAGEPVEPALLAEWGAEAVDASAVLPQGRIPGGWEAKLFAAERCRFRRVLVIDADVTAFSNVDDWFRLLDSRPFAASGDCEIQNSRYNTDLHGIAKDPHGPINSGVQLIDKAGAWPFLMAARWLNDHSDYYYGQRASGKNIVGYGDQDLTRLSLAATATPFHFIGVRPRYHKIGVVLRDAAGAPLAGHRWHAKWHHAKWGAPAFSERLNVFQKDWPHEGLVHSWFADFDRATCRL